MSNEKCRKGKGKQRFFEKKPLRGERRKKLLLIWVPGVATPRSQRNQKFFGSFFQKRTALLS
jgi:hypothetical protein